MTTQPTDRMVPPAVEWLIDELRARVTTLEIELAHWEHSATALAHDPDASRHARGGGRDGRRYAAAGGDADE